MTTIVNTPASGDGSASGMGVGMVLGIVLVILIAIVLFFVYGLPAINNSYKAPQGTGLNVTLVPTTGATGATGANAH